MKVSTGTLAQRIGYLGGAFDPIHVDHINMAQGILELGLADLIAISPCYQHKFGKRTVHSEYRLDMVRLACNRADPKGRIQHATYEHTLGHDGSTYELFNNYILPRSDPSVQFSMIIGQDNANTIERWHEWEKLLQLISFIVVRRPACPEPIGDEWYMQSPHSYVDLGAKIKGISSTKVREMVQRYRGYDELARSGMVTPSVLHYMKTHKLYL